MAYGLFLYKEFVSKSNKTIRLEIFQKDYAGTSAEIESMGNNPLVLVSDNANSSVYLPIVKSYLDISIVDTNQVDYSVFFTPDATKFKIIVKVNGTPEWSGYLTPDSFEQDLRFKGDISLTARDNLGMLSEFDYDLTNSFYSITTLIDTALTKIGFQFTLEYRINKVDSLDETIRNGLTQSKFWIGKTWQEVLETILTGMGCQMRYVGDNKFAIYDIGYLSSLGTPHTPQTFSFIEQGGNQEIIPAWKVLTINQDYGLGDNIYDGFVEQSDYDFYAYRGGDIDNPYNFYLRPFYTIPLSNDWVSTIPMLSPYEYPNIDPNNLYITGKSPETTLFMSSKLIYGKYFEAVSDGKAIQFKFKANNYPHYITQRRTGEYMVGAMLRARYLYTMKVRCNLFAQTATEKYVLQGQRWIPWTISYDDALEFNLPQTKESSVYGKQGTELTSQMDSPQDQDITIEAYGLGESANVWIEFYPYTATYTEVDGLGAVDDYPAIVFDVHTMKLSGFELRIVENEIGGLESKVTINANHNINGAVDLSLGEVPSGLGGYHTYLAGIFKNSHPYYPPMTGFHFTGGTNYKLSELIGREVAHHYKTQKNKLSGTIINSLNFAAMPSFGKTFTDGVKNYALNYGALDFRNETMQVELIEVEDYVTEDYTFVEAEVESGSGSMGSGEREFIQWSSAGNVRRIYELDTASEADQGGSYVMIDKSGLSAAKKVPISSLLVDAYTKTESDSRFASIDGDLTQDFSAKKLTTATLLLPQTAPILASGEVAIYSLDSGFSGELPSGAGSVTSIALTMPTGFAVSGSPITESGTFGVTFASGYFLPTTTQFATKADVSLIGAANGIAPLDSGGKVALQYLPSTLLKYMGVWDASTNTPTLLATDTNRKGQVWNVSVAGTQFGIAFKLGDWLIYNDSGVAEKSDNSDDVVSVNGYTGAVTLKTSDIAEQTNLYYTDARVKAYSDLNYLGISAKAADSDKLDGNDSTYFATATNLSNHTSATNNPHSVTAAQVGAYSATEINNFFYTDVRTITPQTYSVRTLQFGFTSLDLANGSPYADFIRFGGYIDNSGGRKNIILFKKSEFGIRQYQGDFAATTYNHGFVDFWHSGNSGSTSFNWSAAKLASTTLLLPQSAPSLLSGEMAIYGLESGFSGELPSGAGSVTSIGLTVPTGLQVKKDEGGTFAQTATITESGTFILQITNGYALPTTIKQSEWDGKQAKLIGTGASSLVRVNTLGAITYDDSTYLTGNQTITLSGIITGSGTTAITTAIADGALSIAKTSGLQTALDAKMATASYPDLVAIEALAGTSGFLKKTASNTWTLDTNTYLTAITKAQVEAVLTGTITSHNHNGTYALISGATTQDFQVKALTMNGALSGATTGSFSGNVSAASFTSGGNAVIHSGNIGSQSVNYATSAGNSSTTSQRTFDALTLGVATGSGPYSNPYFDNLFSRTSHPNYAVQFGNTGQFDYATYLRFRVNARGVSDTLINALTLAPDYAIFNSEVRATSFVSNGYAVWHSGNLTNTLSNGYLPYWNGSSLVNSVLKSSTTEECSLTINNYYRPSVEAYYGGLKFTGSGYEWGAIKTIQTNPSFSWINRMAFFTMNGDGGSLIERMSIDFLGNIGIGYTDRTEKFAVNGTTYFNGNSQVVGNLTMTENINTNLRIPKVAPTSPTSGQYYFYIVE